ncbi:lyase family protein [Streptomyces rhizosphaericus]|uniref:Fumarate lyase N-terminal domain-containing protein n=1 Tax=Streptomyces rhizosphaericus TaxID=114699 RepID=A0ABN1PGX0_9ACTN|nr:lyase family protein [Streptomyces cangkringensis]
MAVTGRIDGVPSDIWHEEVLAPQFAYEVEHLLGHYLAIEKVLLLEYVRMGLVDAAGAAGIGARLDSLTPDAVRADPKENMSDISFAVERHVLSGPVPPFHAWHVDRSRNDLQVCAQLMCARENLTAVAADLLSLGRAATSLAARYADVPMPGYTHAQAAQIISPGFHLTALAAETTATLRGMLHTYDEVDTCPLGSGTMAGQELAWDRVRMAELLGFSRVQPHALVAVASRGWTMAISGDLARYAVTLSRFATDLMAWGGSGFGFLELPDELSGISAAMPQKRNFPVLERIRGRCAHVAGCAADIAAGQRNTAYTNTVEVSKEAGGHLRTQFDAMRSVLRLTRAVIAGAAFSADRMREACAGEYLGGFTLANQLTLECGIPWRTAQVISGRYIKRALEKGLRPAVPDGSLLATLCADAGYEVARTDALLVAAFDVDEGLRAKRSAGSAHPDEVRAMLADQDGEFAKLTEEWSRRERRSADAARQRDDLLTAAERRS